MASQEENPESPAPDAGFLAPETLNAREFKISRRTDETPRLQEPKESLSPGCGRLQKLIDCMNAEMNELYKRIADLETTDDLNAAELREAKEEWSDLYLKKVESEKCMEKVSEDSTEIILSTLAYQRELEERLKKKDRVLEIFSTRVFRMFKRVRLMIPDGNKSVFIEMDGYDAVVDGDDDDDDDDVEIKQMIQPFVSEMEELEIAFGCWRSLWQDGRVCERR